jgi:peptide/nickel transport system substrate-binding protein
MPKRPSKPSLFKRIKRSQEQVEGLGLQFEETIDEHLFRRFDHLLKIKRFVAGWVGLVLILLVAVIFEIMSLNGYYQKLRPVPGGIYSEGIVGSFTNANPIYATSPADTSVSDLIFAGLFKTGPDGNLVPDLASSYNVDSSERVYTVNLKPGLKWQDGQPLTAKDVVYTFKTIEDPDAQSPLFSSWQGIDVSAPNNNTVIFKLPDVLASFPYELTTGILPEHLLDKISASDLRSASFNSEDPVGAGPFQWQGLNVENSNSTLGEQVQIALSPFAGYNGGKPKLDQFVLQVYPTESLLDNAFKNKTITAMDANDPPSSSVQNKSGVVKHSFTLRAANMVFFKNNSGVLSDQSVRQALVEGVNVPKIISNLSYSTKEVDEPLLMGQLGYNSAYKQYAYSFKTASQTLTSDGWTTGVTGIRYKSGQPLHFTLTADDTTENKMVTNQLKSYWQKLGVQVNIQLLDDIDFQSALDYHDYDAVLAAISIGNDPDVFVYWDSTEADIRSTSRLNFSEFSNSTADLSLEAGRTRLDPALRVIKYQPFLQAWQQAAPALGLYQPRLLYLTNGKLAHIDISTLTSATDRFYNVQNWEIRQARVNS